MVCSFERQQYIINSIKESNNRKHEIIKYLNSSDALEADINLTNFNELLKLIFSNDNIDLKLCDIKSFLCNIEFKLNFNDVEDDIRKNIAWCKSRPKSYFGKQLKEYRKDANGRIIKYNKYYSNGKLDSTTDYYSWVINIIIPKDKKEYFKLDMYSDKLLDKLFNYQSENVNTFCSYNDDNIKKVVFVLEDGYITNIIVFVDELKTLYNYKLVN